MTKKETAPSADGQEQGFKAFFLARPMSAAPAAQVLLAAYVAHRYHPIIPTKDILFCVLFPAYLFLANRYRFSSNILVRRRPEDHPHSASKLTSKFFSGSEDPWFARYMITAATIGLLMPLVTIYCFPGEVAELAAPHLFVLWCQIVCESVAMMDPYVHRYMALLLPIGFRAYGMNQVIDWFLGSLSLFGDNFTSLDDISAEHAWGLAVAGVNLAFWTYNLFVTLLLKIAPEYLSEDKCEAPEVRVITLPFIGEPTRKVVESKQ